MLLTEIPNETAQNNLNLEAKWYGSLRVLTPSFTKSVAIYTSQLNVKKFNLEQQIVYMCLYLYRCVYVDDVKHLVCLDLCDWWLNPPSPVEWISM